MFLRIRLIIILVCVGIGVTPHFLWADSHLRLAKAYAEKNDVEKASHHFGLALNNAPPKQVASIASDYAAFLVETGNFHKAELILRQALTQSPHDEVVTRVLARCLVLQKKITEGRRYFRLVCSEAETREAIAAICREQGNADTLVTMEKKWGTAQPAPTLVAAVPKPAMPEKAAPPLPLVPTVVALNTVPRPAAVVPTARVAITPVAPTLLPSHRIVASTSRPALLSGATPPEPEKQAVVSKNPVKWVKAPRSNMSEEMTSRPVVVVLPRRHYVVNAADVADLEAPFPIKPVAATEPADCEP